MDAFYDDETMMMAWQKHKDMIQEADRERLERAALEDTNRAQASEHSMLAHGFLLQLFYRVAAL